MPKEPKQEMTRAQMVNHTLMFAQIIAYALLPFLRVGVGSRAYVATPFTFVLMLAFTEYCPLLVYYIPVWMCMTLWRCCTPNHSAQSHYQGESRLRFITRNDKTAELLEVGLVFVTGMLISQVYYNLGCLLTATSVAMGFVLWIKLAYYRSMRIAANDARVEMNFQSRMQKGEGDW